jgi:hypothetical protein
MQALILFLVAPIGALGAFAFLSKPAPNQDFSTGIMLAVVSAAAVVLGAWLWIRKP